MLNREIVYDVIAASLINGGNFADIKSAKDASLVTYPPKTQIKNKFFICVFGG